MYAYIGRSACGLSEARKNQRNMADSTDHWVFTVDSALRNVARGMSMHVSNHNKLTLSTDIPENLISPLMKVDAADQTVWIEFVIEGIVGHPRRIRGGTQQEGSALTTTLTGGREIVHESEPEASTHTEERPSSRCPHRSRS